MVVPLLVEMSKDSVPNVKIASAKALKACYKYTQSQNDKVKALSKMKFLKYFGFNIFCFD